MAHVDANFGDDHLLREITDAQYGRQHFDGGTKGFDVVVDLLVDVGNGRVKLIQMIQMELQHKAVMRRHATTQSGL
jgi:hypothetical protein